MMPEQARQFVRACKRKYPNPKSGSVYGQANTYCVGGAVVLFASYWWTRLYAWFYNISSYYYPVLRLRSVLQKLNPSLSLYMAHRYLAEVISKNDAGDFDAAWNAVERALCHPLKPYFEAGHGYPENCS